MENANSLWVQKLNTHELRTVNGGTPSTSDQAELIGGTIATTTAAGAGLGASIGALIATVAPLAIPIGAAGGSNYRKYCLRNSMDTI